MMREYVSSQGTSLFLCNIHSYEVWKMVFGRYVLCRDIYVLDGQAVTVARGRRILRLTETSISTTVVALAFVESLGKGPGAAAVRYLVTTDACTGRWCASRYLFGDLLSSVYAKTGRDWASRLIRENRRSQIGRILMNGRGRLTSSRRSSFGNVQKGTFWWPILTQ